MKIYASPGGNCMVTFDHKVKIYTLRSKWSNKTKVLDLCKASHSLFGHFIKLNYFLWGRGGGCLHAVLEIKIMCITIFNRPGVAGAVL